MKQKIFVGLLIIEALACMLFCILQTSFLPFYSAAMAFPFEQIGIGLRLLSLSSQLGNAIAIAIYFSVCLLPIAAIIILQKKRKLFSEDVLLGVLSVVLFAVLYIMINPGLINMWMGRGTTQAVEKAVLGGMVYSVLSGYFVLRALRLFSNGNTEKLVRYMSIMLHLLTTFFVYSISGACFSGLLNSIATLQEANVGNEHLLVASYLFLVMQYLLNALPYILNVFVVFASLRLLDEMRLNRYSAETVIAIQKTSSLCITALVTTVLANISFNLLQLIFSKSLLVIKSSIQIPVFSITFVLAALLLTRFVAENTQLKNDNDMFI